MDYNARAAAAVAQANQVGTVQKAYGKAGELVIRLWDTFPDNTEEPLWVEIDSVAVPLFIASFTRQGNSKAVVTFDDFESEELAEMLIGKKIYSESPEEGEIEADWDFLIGYRFLDATSKMDGVITNFIGSELNPLIEVEILGKQHLLPIADELVEHLDQKKKILEMRLAEGIFEL